MDKRKKVARGLLTKDSLTWLAAVLQRFISEELFLLSDGEVSVGKRW